MKTTLHIPDSLMMQAKKVAAQQGTTVKELILEGLCRVLKDRTLPPGTFRLRKVTFKGDGLQADLAGVPWERIRERIYEGRGE